MMPNDGQCVASLNGTSRLCVSLNGRARLADSDPFIKGIVVSILVVAICHRRIAIHESVSFTDRPTAIDGQNLPRNVFSCVA
jgi:hypothetical protein